MYRATIYTKHGVGGPTLSLVARGACSKPRATQRIKPKYSVKQKGAPKPIYPHSRRFASNRPVFRPSATPARGSVGRPVRPRGPKTPFQNESYVDICRDPRLDAITVLGNGTTFAFKDDLYWRLNQKSYEEGYPRQISPDWDGLPGHLDAAITDYDGDTYFFKGDSYWLYDPNGRRYKGYPRRISDGLVDVPDDIEAAMIWNYDDKPYFFKRSKYWQYSRWGQQPTWPRSIHEISSQLPHRLDAALKWTNAKSYIFAGHQYYRLSGWRHMKVVPGYPRHVGEWWFGCPKQRRTRRTRSISPRPDIFNQAHQDTCPTKGCCKSHYSKTIDYTQK